MAGFHNIFSRHCTNDPGSKQPAAAGTGTENYYGRAWRKLDFFESASHAHPSGDRDLKPGFMVNARYRSLDAIPFDKSIRFDMELCYWARTVMSYAPTTLWYARPGATWDVKPSAVKKYMFGLDYIPAKRN